MQPVDEPRSGRRVRRADDPRRAGTARPQALGAPRERRGSRAVKYRHLLDEALSLDGAEISLLAVLMLRGPQTPGELKGRSERLHRFGSLADVETTLAGADRARARRAPAAAAGAEGGALRAAARRRGRGRGRRGVLRCVRRRTADDARVEALEARVDRLEDELASLRGALESVRERRF